MSSKEVKKNNNKLIVILVGIIIFLVIVIYSLLFFKKADEGENILNNTEVKDNYNYSFHMLDATDNKLNNDQKDIAKFFDENYFFLYSYDELVKYADTLKNIRVATHCQVSKFLSTDEENFEIVCNWGNSDDYFFGEDASVLKDAIIIRGTKPDSMFTFESILNIKGKLVGAETVTIEGKNYYLPVIEVFESVMAPNWYSEETIKNVAKTMFGNNVVVRRPTPDESYEMATNYIYSFTDSIWLVEFENQSNLNFKVFDIWQSYPFGLVTYNALYNQGIESDYFNKYLYLTPDLQKYIVFDSLSRYDDYIYISVYDRDLNKLWSREIPNVSRMVWDATDTQLTIVSDNDMYNIDIKSGENLMEPVYVGKKTNVAIVENGYILLADSSDDAVMFLDKSGKIVNKFDIKIDVSDEDSLTTKIQRIDNNYVILYTHMDYTNNYEVTSKYIIIDQNGKLIKETE